MGSQFLHVNEPGFDQVVELLTCYRGDLSEIRQALRTLTDKVDSLMKESTAHDQPGMCSPAARSTPYNTLLTLTPITSLEPHDPRRWEHIISEGNVVRGVEFHWYVSLPCDTQSTSSVSIS